MKMAKQKIEKFTFNKEPPATGLAAVGHPNPDTRIKHNRKDVGWISGPSWQTKDHKWSIFLRFIDKDAVPAGWSNRTLKATFDTEPEARVFLQENAAKLIAKGLFPMDEDA